MRHFKLKLFSLIIPAFCLLTACGVNLHPTRLSVGLYGESYEYLLDYGYDGADWWDNPDFFLAQTDGELPYGVGLSSNGYVYGTPEEVGNFEFRVTAVSITDSCDWSNWGDEWCNGDDDTSRDSEWFTLFVTEPSTNADCPLPNDESTTETYVCLGLPEATSLAQYDLFTLDVNYFVSFDEGASYDINQVAFTIYYDADLFAPDPSLLNSQSLREAATRTNATVTFDDSIPGELYVVVTGGDVDFHMAGRFMDIDFYALQDIPAGEYFFDLTVNDITSSHGADLPPTYALWGSILVDEDTVAEEDTTDEATTDEATTDEATADETTSAADATM